MFDGGSTRSSVGQLHGHNFMQNTGLARHAEYVIGKFDLRDFLAIYILDI
jgi:hypothetical protein